MPENPWDKSYPTGVSWSVPIETGPVQGILEKAAAIWPNQVALNSLGRTITYAELDEFASRFASFLQAMGVGPGVHVGLYLPNTPHYVVAFFGVLRAGGTVVNYSPLDAESVLAHKVDDSETRILITLDSKALYPQMLRLLQLTQLRQLIVGTLDDFGAVSTPDMADVIYNEEVLRFSGFLKHGTAPIRHDVKEHTIAVLQYTGGTTGLPKGAVLTHGNLTAASSQIWHTVQTQPAVLRAGEERTLAVLPPFHIYALVVNMLVGLKLGAEIVMHARFDMDAILQDIAAKKITVFFGVPTMFVGLLSAPRDRLNLKSLRFVNSGGAPLPLEVQSQFEALAGTPLREGWGMTETSAIGTFSPATIERPAGSCGLPAPGIEFRFMDVADPERVLRPGERGEICVRGPNVMQSYWKNPKATADAFTPDRFLRTGDVGYMDENGFVFIVDRTKDMLLCSGYNVYPRVIEEAIYEHEAVAEVAVIGIPDAYRGQAPKAFIRLRSDAKPPSLEDMKAFLKPRLGKHEMIAEIEWVEALPRTPVGKIDKKALHPRAS